MDIRIKTDKIGTRFVKALLLVLLSVAVITLAAPAVSNAKDLVLEAEQTLIKVSLKAEEGPAKIKVKGWYCDYNKTLEFSRDYASERLNKDAFLNKELLDWAKLILIYDKRQNDPVKFWWEMAGRLNPPFKDNWTWTVSPAQGTTQTVSEKNCYTRPELDAAMREAIRWANWILKNKK